MDHMHDLEIVQWQEASFHRHDSEFDAATTCCKALWLILPLIKKNGLMYLP